MNLRQQSKLPPASVEAFLSWPRAGNAGDWLIADACERFLADRGIDTWRSDGSIEDAALAGDTEYLGDLFGGFRGMLIFSGGGNIGIYPDNAALRKALISHSGPRCHCLVFPQSALSPEPALVNARVTVWCRDAASQAILRQAEIRTELVPDIALYMDDIIPRRPGGAGFFQIKRTRGGDAEAIEHDIALPCDSADLTRASGLDRIISALEPYEFVLSDRLHGGLIAAMMRKKVVFLPVGYHKIKSFYDTWLCSLPGNAFVGTQDELQPALSALEPPRDDLRELFCRHAQPAFDRFLLKG
jgi:exopolysaccharide biosynthesis predicted pyruvyltransferase EpsI